MLAFCVLAPAATQWTATPVVSDIADQVNPAISGSRVVWQDFRNKASGCPTAQNCQAADIFVKDLNGGAEQRLTTTPNGLDPDISGNLVTWRDWDTGKIVVYNLTDSTKINASTVGGTVQQVTPAISGNRVVWADYRNSSDYGDIYMRDLATGADVAVALGDPLLAKPQRDKRNPDIDGNIVVWEDWRNAFQDAQGWWHNPDIYAKDVVSGTVYPVCTNTDDQYSPVVSGTRVFWQDYRNGNWDIYMKDLATGVETRLTTNTQQQSWPSADGDFVVFKDTRNGNEDIYLKRISTGVEQMISADPVTNSSALQKLPVISGTTIAWMDKSAGNWDIYSAKDTGPPQILAASPTGATASTSATITATWTDPGTAINPAAAAVTLDGASLTGCSASESALTCPPVTGLAPGAHSYTVSGADIVGNTTSATFAFTVDTAAPVISNVAPHGWVNSNALTLTAAYADTGSGINLATPHLLLDGVPAACNWGPGSISCAVTGLADGVHDIAFDVADNAGNIGTATAQFTVDTVAPQVSATAPTGSISTTAATISVTYADPAPSSGIDPGSALMTIDGIAADSCLVDAAAISCAISNLSDGAHVVSVTVSDLSGNQGRVSWSFFVNNVIPFINGPQPAPGASVNNPRPVIAAGYAANGRGIDNAAFRVYVDGANVTAASLVTADTITYQPPPDAPLADGSHTARFIVRDTAGGLADQSWSFKVTSPRIAVSFSSSYWGGYSDYVHGRLSVDYQVLAMGTGVAAQLRLETAYASDRVTLATSLPLELGTLPPDGKLVYTLIYIVPAGVNSFRTDGFTSFMDDGGNLYGFGGSGPAGPAACITDCDASRGA
ncbi:MAG: hypothetical protein ACYCXF_01915 [Thermoleophilia bacterium]